MLPTATFGYPFSESLLVSAPVLGVVYLYFIVLFSIAILKTLIFLYRQRFKTAYGFKISLDSSQVFRIKGGESYHNQFLLKLVGDPLMRGQLKDMLTHRSLLRRFGRRTSPPTIVCITTQYLKALLNILTLNQLYNTNTLHPTPVQSLKDFPRIN